MDCNLFPPNIDLVFNEDIIVINGYGKQYNNLKSLDL